METPGIPLTRWFDAVSAAEGSGGSEGQRAGDVRPGPRQQQHHAHPGIDESVAEARSAGRRRSASDHLGVACGRGRSQGQHVPAAGMHPVRDLGLARGVEPIAAVGRADRSAELRVQGRLSGHLSDGQEARLRRPDVQEHQGRRRPPGARGRSARNKSRKLEHRLHRPVAGAAEGAHEEPARNSIW